MSDRWSAEDLVEAQPAGAWARPVPTGHFTPWSGEGHPRRRASDFAPSPRPAAPVTDIESLRSEAFAEGFEQGRQAVIMEFARDREALSQLIRSAQAIQPEHGGPLAAVLAETVTRLVRQIVGEVKIDPELLKARAGAVAELVTAECGPARLRMHPDDIAMLEGIDLGLPVAPDHHLVSGQIIMETGEGWIEDGPQVRLAALRTKLDSMGLPR